jgi:hypothetical protein
LKEFTREKDLWGQIADMVHLLTGELSKPLCYIMYLPLFKPKVIECQNLVSEVRREIRKIESLVPLLYEVAKMGRAISEYEPYVVVEHWIESEEGKVSSERLMKEYEKKSGFYPVSVLIEGEAQGLYNHVPRISRSIIKSSFLFSCI